MKKLLFIIVFVSLLFGCSSSANDEDETITETPTVTETTTETTETTTETVTQTQQETSAEQQETQSSTSQEQQQENTQEQSQGQTQEQNQEEPFIITLPANAPDDYEIVSERIWNKDNLCNTNTNNDSELLTASSNINNANYNSGLYERIAGTNGIFGKYKKNFTDSNGIEKTKELWMDNRGRLVIVTYNNETPNNKSYGYYYFAFNNNGFYYLGENFVIYNYGVFEQYTTPASFFGFSEHYLLWY